MYTPSMLCIYIYLSCSCQVSDPDTDFTLALVQSKVNATTKKRGVCAHFGVKIKGTDFTMGHVVMIP